MVASYRTYLETCRATYTGLEKKLSNRLDGSHLNKVYDAFSSAVQHPPPTKILALRIHYACILCRHEFSKYSTIEKLAFAIMFISLGVLFPQFLGSVIFIFSWYASSKFLSEMMSPKPKDIIDKGPLERLMISIFPTDPPLPSPLAINPLTPRKFRLHSKREPSVDFQCRKLNLGMDKKVLKGSAAIGNTIGMIFGGVIGGMPGPLIAGATGGILGASLGAIFCASQGLYSRTENVICQMKENNSYGGFKMAPGIQEEYTHFVNFLRTHPECLPENLKAEIQQRLCQKTQTFPEFPVFLPHDHQRLHVYERTAIEQILSQKKEDIAEYARKKHQNNVSENKIKSGVMLLLKNDDLFREGYFTTSELVYDPTYAKSTISLLQQIQKHLIENPSIEQAEIVCQGIQYLISHYEAQYKQVMMRITSKLGTEVLNTLKDLPQANKITDRMREIMMT